jgi:hypothetical protein
MTLSPEEKVSRDDWTSDDAIRVMGIGMFRFLNRDEPGSLPSNGTEGDMRMEDAAQMFRRCPGLRYVMEAGIRALAGDKAFEQWLIPLYAGGEDDCRTTELVLAATLAPDPEPDPNAMTWEQVSDAMIADLHDRYPDSPR